MKISTPVLILLISVLKSGYAATASDISEAFNKNEIIPDVIDNAPAELLNVKYAAEEVNLGNALKPGQAKEQPGLNWKADSNKFYLLSMIDPDAPSRLVHALREVNYWLVGNIPGHDLEKGETLAAYLPPAPPVTTGLHRYIFLIFEQPGTLTFDEPKISNTSAALQRVKFTIRKFADKYKLGHPVAGNFFQAEFDTAAAAEKLKADVDMAQDKVKEGVENFQTMAKEGVESAQTAVKEGVETAQVKIKEGVEAAQEMVKSGVETAQEKLKEGADAVRDRLKGIFN